MTLDSIVNIIQERASNADPLNSTLKFNLGGQIIYLDGNDKNKVSTEDKEAECTVTMSSEDFQDMIDGKLNPMMAFMGGKIKIDGDMGVAMSLQSILG